MPATPQAAAYLPMARERFHATPKPSGKHSDEFYIRTLAGWFAAHDRDALARGGKTIIDPADLQFTKRLSDGMIVDREMA